MKAREKNIIISILILFDTFQGLFKLVYVSIHEK